MPWYRGACLLVVVATFGLPAFARGQSVAPRVPVTGMVQDQTGGMLPDAEVTLTGGPGSLSRTTRTDGAGAFRFEDVTAGVYELRAQFAGLEPAVVRLQVGLKAPGRQKLILKIAGLKEDVVVGTQSAAVTLDGAQNQGGVSVDKTMLADIPAFDRDFIGALSAFLDPSAGGTGGTTLIIDGMEGQKVGVSASAIQQIKINQDPYAAEYARPGQGRVEVITKAGTDRFHGEANVTFRDGHLDARNAFAVSKPDDQRRIFEGMLTGPVGDGRTTSFMVSVNREETDQHAIVYAQGPTGEIRDTVPATTRNLELSGTINHQQGKNNTLTLRMTFQSESSTNDGVGGTTLPEAGSNASNRELQFIFSLRTMLTNKLINQVRVLAGGDHQPVFSVSPGQKIIVQDAFTGGGAQADRVAEERHVTLNDTLMWSAGRHVVKGGFAIPDWSHRYSNDRTNLGGTFSFESLTDYTAGRPYLFTQQQGDGNLAFLQKVLGAFVQDEFTARRNLTFSFGIRYDWLSFFGDRNNLAPRASVAWAPGSKPGTVIRGGVGVFYDRASAGTIADVLRSRQGRLVRYAIQNPGYPDPFAAGAGLTTQPTTLVQLAPDFVIPWALQFGGGIERQLAKATTFAVNYIGSEGHDLFRSRDINAPPPPRYLARPDPTHATIRQIESTGRQWSHSLQFTLRGRVSAVFSGSVQYVLSQTRNDTNGINVMPPNNFDLSGEWSRANTDQRHRFDMVGTLKTGPWFTLGINVSLRSGAPYSLTLGQDLYNTGFANARPPGEPRNSLVGPSSARLDLRWSHVFVLGKSAEDEARKLTIGIDAFNVLNHVNYNGYVGNMQSPFFGQATSAQPARRLQLSMRFEF